MVAKPYIKPGYLTKLVKSDDRRGEFDCKNQVVVQNELPVDFLFIGDSITQMWELNAYFYKSGQCILNRGVGGDRTEYLLNRFIADAVQLKPKYCITMVGINDAWELEFDHWKQLEGKSVKEVLDYAIRNMEQVMKIAADEKMQMIICSILPTMMNFTNREPQRQQYTKLYNEQLKYLSERYRFPYIDYHSYFVREDGLTMKDGYTIEGLHPNVFGYNMMTYILKKELYKIKIEI